MAKPIKFPVRRVFRHDADTDNKLIEEADKREMKPAELIRVLIRAAINPGYDKKEQK